MTRLIESSFVGSAAGSALAALLFLSGCADVTVMPDDAPKICKFRDCVILERVPAVCGPWVWGTADDAGLFIAADAAGAAEWECRRAK